MFLVWVLVMWVRTLLLLITLLDKGSRVVMKDNFTKQNAC
jgi:hypothetical protein